METVLLIIDLLIALSLIGVVLLQRSEGGGLGMGGGGGGGVMSGRAAADALGRVTWGLGAAFFVCTLALTIISANNSAGASVVDRIQPVGGGADTSLPDLGTSLLPPSAEESGPVVPDAGATSATPEGFVLPEADATEGDLSLPESGLESGPEAETPAEGEVIELPVDVIDEAEEEPAPAGN
ncbi:preprotein translocase subunit SecG [Pseudoroseicyclus tamaricis]|uniref:Protein-export membrane protein SecG n=1 Tax=Pseudoroseicyclus tamaricis TaxID=2705421 RepID=A0A6B2JSG4_9RHOB|nr:preprotein translocase subunit SecG [Pseudoroseicyclus tamaricis]NDV01497.1 preprotein translocase subunit SecG [Pseudoroseicyclus tamaricis]